MDEQLARNILKQSQYLATLPQTMAEVLRVARDDQSCAEDLAKVLLKDATLTANVLKIVNSPYYGVDGKVSSVNQAVVRIGMRQVVALALSCSVYRMTSDWESSLDRERFWRHSLEVAMGARMIAEQCGSVNTDDAFVAGLLHDMGLLILERAFPAQFSAVWEKANQAGEMIEIEHARWGTDHAQVGQFLFERWNLPEGICLAIGQHHRFPTGDPIASTPRLAAVLYLAGVISKFTIAWEQTINPVQMNEKALVRDLLGVDADALRSLERQLLSSIMDEAAYLEIDVGSPQEIMMEANRVLFEQYTTVENLLKELQDLQQEVKAEDLQNSLWERTQ